MTTIANPVPKRTWGLTGDSIRGLIGKIILLGLVAGLAAAMAVPLISREQWLFLAILILTTVAIFVVYLQPWHIPIKYLVPGTIFLIAFQVIPVVATFATRSRTSVTAIAGSKQDAVLAIETASVTQVAGSAEYVLTIATEGDPATGDLVFLLYDPTTKTVQQGTAEGLTPRTDVTVGSHGQGHRGARTDGPQHRRSCVEARRHQGDGHPDRRRRDQGLRASRPTRATRQSTTRRLRLRDRIRRPAWSTPRTRLAGSSSARRRGARQGWLVGVGLDNFTRTFTDPAVAGPIVGIMGWNFAFAIITVIITFAAGLLVAVTLNSPRLRGLRFYRVLIILPYAMPSFAMLLVWRDMFNADFGLMNRSPALNINWYGNVWTARFAILPSSSGSATRTCSWSASARSSRSPGHDGSGSRGRRQAVPGVPGGRLPAAADRRGAAAHRLVRVQLQQLQRHRADDRRRSVPA